MLAFKTIKAASIAAKKEDLFDMFSQQPDEGQTFQICSNQMEGGRYTVAQGNSYFTALDRRLWQEMLDYISDGILLTDRKGNILAYNTAWANLALDQEAQYPNRIENVYQFPGWLSEKKVTAIEVLRTRKECVNVLRSPAGRVLVSRGKPLFDAEGGVQYALVNIQDVSAALSLRDNVDNGEEIRKLYRDYMKGASQRSANTPVVINPKMAAIYEQCMTISTVDATVLILGESGTGKEVLADFIHKNSHRKDQPFLSINCGAIPENLLESELFGYEPGAFTGASRTGKAGRMTNCSITLRSSRTFPGQPYSVRVW